MDRVAVRTPNLLPLCLTEEGDIVARGDICVDVLQSYIHGTNFNAKFREAREEVEEVVRSQSEFGRLDVARREIEVR